MRPACWADGIPVVRILALDSATGRCSATIVTNGRVVASRHADVERGQAALLPAMVRACLNEAGFSALQLDCVAVTVGPGSFTGIRGGIALAQGLAVAAGIPAVGVTVGEALGLALPQLGRRQLWVAGVSRRGRVFLEIGEQMLSVAVTDLPVAVAPVAVAGSAAAEIASRLAARGVNVMLTDARWPSGVCIAQAAERRMLGQLRHRAVEPAYIDAPQALLAVAGG